MDYKFIDILFYCFSYLVGSLSFAIIVSKLMNIEDPRSYGSQNAGATNVMRSGNKFAGFLTFFGDFAKGFIVVILAKLFFRHDLNFEQILAISSTLVIIGHIFPVFFKFKGGIGVATAIGVFLGIYYIVGLYFVVVWFIIYKLFKVSSLAAIVALIVTPVYAFFYFGDSLRFGAILIISIIVLAKHRTNILRLFVGKEHKFSSHQDGNNGK
ncbi:MAG: glycerol-3-phosphate 1-O-acyltransferase PlsY [Burkholderiales bacterium]|nr:glycerol-3-phosphate 1-O-acyltransferase PlsY [Burkholderiales bacterium]